MGTPKRKWLDESEYLALETIAGLRHEPAGADTVFKEAPCLLVEVLSASTAATDTREKLQAYQGIASLRYYVLVDSERLGVSYCVRGADAEWLAATLDSGERLQVDCGTVHAGLSLDDIYEDTGLLVA